MAAELAATADARERLDMATEQQRGLEARLLAAAAGLEAAAEREKALAARLAEQTAAAADARQCLNVAGEQQRGLEARLEAQLGEGRAAADAAAHAHAELERRCEPACRQILLLREGGHEALWTRMCGLVTASCPALLPRSLAHLSCLAHHCTLSVLLFCSLHLQL